MSALFDELHEPTREVATAIAAARPARLWFRLTCVPPTTNHQRKRIVRVGKWTRLADAPQLVTAKAQLEQLLLPHVPPTPMTGPVRLTLEFTWPWRTSDPKKVRALGRSPHTTKPDCSNVAKTLEDRLVFLRFLEDDALVSELIVRKWRGEDAGITVTLESLAPAEGKAS